MIQPYYKSITASEWKDDYPEIGPALKEITDTQCDLVLSQNELICDNLDCFKFKPLPKDKCYILEYDSLRGITLDIVNVPLFLNQLKIKTLCY